MPSNKIGQQMMQQKHAVDDGSGAEDDQTYLPRVFFYNCVDTIHFCKFTSYLKIEQVILIGIFECYKIYFCNINFYIIYWLYTHPVEIKHSFYLTVVECPTM